jgi:hypothetical protein
MLSMIVRENKSEEMIIDTWSVIDGMLGNFYGFYAVGMMWGSGNEVGNSRDKRKRMKMGSLVEEIEGSLERGSNIKKLRCRRLNTTMKSPNILVRQNE